MLIKKEYNFEAPKKELEHFGIGFLKNFYYKSINKMVKELYNETKGYEGYENIIVYIGSYIFTLIKDAYNIDTPGINFEYIDFRNFINIVDKKPKDSTLIGFLINREIYYSSSLKNEIIISDNKQEAEMCITLKERKNKLKKLR